ncbi:ribose/galactose isomerase [Aspergillus luchuensis]|uniref:Ribose/galactose isomerase n=1 Tax=Aspergillus kawachii TaxID=1069201 RepID=A0A146FT44_ASPKA|nr:ribose/galactose isomerase [Aspergillus luchuensis]
MATNGHFAAIGNGSSDKTAYEHGVQVIDENKEFK